VQPPPKNKSNSQLKEQKSLLGLHALAAPLQALQIKKARQTVAPSPCCPFMAIKEQLQIQYEF
jgi:hypothetical protein